MFRCIVGFFCLLVVNSSFSAQHVKWNLGDDFDVFLYIGDERKVVFPEPVMMFDKQYYRDLFNSSLISNVIFITPKKDFFERVLFKGVESGNTYIANLKTGSDSGIEDELRIHLNDDFKKDDEVVAPSNPVTDVDLVQFAAQNLFAPDSLLEPISGVRRVKLKKEHIYSNDLYSGGKLYASPLASWSHSNRYVTAVQFNNTSNLREKFDPCKVRGDFVSVTPQFESLMPVGESNDFTVVYFISISPFEQAVSKRVRKCN